MTTPQTVLRAADKMDATLGATIGNSKELLRDSITRLERRMIDGFKELSTDGKGHLVGPRVNLKQAQQMHKDLINIYEEEYGKGARRAINGFNDVALAIQNNFKSLDVAATFTRVDKDLIATLRGQALQEFEQFGLASQEKIAAAMYDTVVAKGSWAELVATMRGVLAGGKDANGLSLAAYSNTWANDSIMNFHQQVALKKARDAGLVMFLYYGNVVGQSRPFCIDRAGKVYSQKQIESWNGMTWAGKSGAPLTYRGGYNCRHHWQPVKKDWIPDDSIEVGDYFEEKGLTINRGTTIPAWPGTGKISKRKKKTPVNPHADPFGRYVPVDDIYGDNARAWSDQIYTHGEAYAEEMGMGPCGPVADNIVDVLQGQGKKARVMYTSYLPPGAKKASDAYPHYVAVELDEADNVIRIYDPTNPHTLKRPIVNLEPGAKPRQYWPQELEDTKWGKSGKTGTIDEMRDNTEVMSITGRSTDEGLFHPDDVKWFNDKMSNPALKLEAIVKAGEDEYQEALKKVRAAGTATEIEMGVGYVKTNVPLGSLDPAKVAAIKKRILAGDKFNPLVVMGDVDDPVVIDGLHRMRAYLELYGNEHKIKFITTEKHFYQTLQARTKALKVHGGYVPEVEDVFDTQLKKLEVYKQPGADPADTVDVISVADVKAFKGTATKNYDKVAATMGEFNADQLDSVSGLKQFNISSLHTLQNKVPVQMIKDFKGTDFSKAGTFWEEVVTVRYKGKVYLLDTMDVAHATAARLSGTYKVFTKHIDLDKLIADAKKGQDLIYKPAKNLAGVKKATEKILEDAVEGSGYKYSRAEWGNVGDKDEFFWKFNHDEWAGFKYYGTRLEKTKLIHKKVIMDSDFTHETMEGVNWKLVELQNRANRLGIPPLRAINAKNAADIQGNWGASMGDGVLSLNSQSFNRDFAGWVSDVKHYKKQCDTFVKTGKKVLPTIEKAFGKRSNEYRVLKEQIDMRAAEAKRIKDKTWTGPSFGGAREDVSKYRPGVAQAKSKFPPFGNQRPWTAEQYYDNAYERGYSTMDHEFGHHVHQQMFASDWSAHSDPPLEKWLAKHIHKTNLDNAPTRYSIDRWEDGRLKYREWFAENYALWKGGRKGLVDPYLHGLMEAIDDVEAGKISQGDLLNKIMTPKGNVRNTVIKAKGKYGPAKTLTYNSNELQVIQALAKKPAMSRGAVEQALDWDTWEGDYTQRSSDIARTLSILRTKGVIKRAPLDNSKWVLHAATEEAVTGAKVAKKKWTTTKLREALTGEERYLLARMDGGGEMDLAEFIADYELRVDTPVAEVVARFKELGIVKELWRNPGTGQANVRYIFLTDEIKNLNLGAI